MAQRPKAPPAASKKKGDAPRSDPSRLPADVSPFLHSIVENLPNMIFVKDAKELRFALFNRAGEELLGYPREEMIGKNDYDFFPAEEVEFFESKDREVLEGGKLVDIAEEPIHTRHGTRILHTKKIPILDDDGNPQFLLGISEDITEKKAAERRLRRAERLASIGTLAAGIAHEINNPIGAILLYAQSAREMGKGGNENLDRMLDAIVDESMRCGRIVRSILQFAKQESTDKEPTAVNPIVRRAADIAARDGKAHDAVIELKLARGLPRIHANVTEIEQALVNLIQNSIESRARGVHVTLSTELTEGGSVRIGVEDDGPGIPEADREFVFDPFYSNRRQRDGAGLGLSIVRGLVESHGGTVELDAGFEGGTRMVVELPAEGDPGPTQPRS